MYLFSFVAVGRFQHIWHSYPVTGHPYLPNDRDYGCSELNIEMSVFTLSTNGWLWLMKNDATNLSKSLQLQGGNRKWLVSKGWSVQLICKHILPCIHVHVRKMLAINTAATHSVYLGLFFAGCPRFLQQNRRCDSSWTVHSSVHTTLLNAKSVCLSAQSSCFCLLAWRISWQ